MQNILVEDSFKFDKKPFKSISKVIRKQVTHLNCGGAFDDVGRVGSWVLLFRLGNDRVVLGGLLRRLLGATFLAISWKHLQIGFLFLLVSGSAGSERAVGSYGYGDHEREKLFLQSHVHGLLYDHSRLLLRLLSAFVRHLSLADLVDDLRLWISVSAGNLPTRSVRGAVIRNFKRVGLQRFNVRITKCARKAALDVAGVIRSGRSFFFATGRFGSFGDFFGRTSRVFYGAAGVWVGGRRRGVVVRFRRKVTWPVGAGIGHVTWMLWNFGGHLARFHDARLPRFRWDRLSCLTKHFFNKTKHTAASHESSKLIFFD